MIPAALKAGAVLGGANDTSIEILESAGEKIGVAFQIQDDILDVIGTQEELGKPVLSDEKNQKSTYVTIYGVDESIKIVKRLSAEAVELLENFGDMAEFLVELTKYLIDRKF